LDATASRSYYIPADNASHGDNWGATLTFNVPLFTGYGDSYDRQRAQWEALATEADAQTLVRRIALEVWTAYHQLRTSADQVREARALLETSTKWEALARGRYEAGVGTILDLMTAQSALASARSREVEARADWLLALVRLTHGTGELDRRTIAAPSAHHAPSPSPRESR
jgi:outer membrane protein TolC